MKRFKAKNIEISIGMKVMVYMIVILFLSTGTAAAAPTLSWHGLTRDKVGQGGNPNPDNIPDGYFTLNIDLGGETKTIAYIRLAGIDARGIPTGNYWDTDPATGYWILGVEQPTGARLNPTDTLIRKTVSGNTNIELYADSNGNFVLGNYFKATIRFTDGTLFDATVAIPAELPKEFPINLKWNGLTRDKVGQGGNPNPDNIPDGYFTLNIDLGGETKTIAYIRLTGIDERGMPTGNYWDADPATGYWILGVEQPLGTRLNPTDTLIRKTVSGNTNIELYADSNGHFVLGNYFKATIRFTDGTLLDTSTPIGDITITPTPTSGSSDRLNSGDTLKVGASIISQNGQYRLTLQDDGNLVLYNLANSPLWASNTMNNNVAQIVMQTDGNMVMADSGNQQIWSTGTSGNSGAYLIVQNDGNAIIYNIAGTKLWSTSQTQPPTPITGLSVRRTFDKTTLTAGSDVIVTIVIQNDNTARALSLQESTPPGWSFTRISDDADQFKAVTDEWMWLSLVSNAVKTVKYKLTVPPGTKLGTYNINGHITTGGATTDVTGDTAISVATIDMLSYYRGLGVDPNKVETSDLLKAADDWRNNIIPQGFSVSIATGQLLTLADEWRNS